MIAPDLIIEAVALAPPAALHPPVWLGLFVLSFILMASATALLLPPIAWRRIGQLFEPPGPPIEPVGAIYCPPPLEIAPMDDSVPFDLTEEAANDPPRIEPPLEITTPVTAPAPDLVDRRCKMDLAATREGLELTIELPGLEAQDVEIQAVGAVLTISGELRLEPDHHDKTYRLAERDYGVFSRSIELPEGVRADKIRAALSRGVLTVTIPNPCRPEARRIEVQAAAMYLAETRDGLELSVELPGLEREDVEVEVSDGVLSVKGERKYVFGPREPANGERGQAAVSRSIELPDGVDADQISAALSRGVLTVTIPNPTRPAPKNIPVRAAA